MNSTKNDWRNSMVIIKVIMVITIKRIPMIIAIITIADCDDNDSIDDIISDSNNDYHNNSDYI